MLSHRSTGFLNKTYFCFLDSNHVDDPQQPTKLTVKFYGSDSGLSIQAYDRETLEKLELFLGQQSDLFSTVYGLFSGGKVCQYFEVSRL